MTAIAIRTALSHDDHLTLPHNHHRYSYHHHQHHHQHHHLQHKKEYSNRVCVRVAACGASGLLGTGTCRSTRRPQFALKDATSEYFNSLECRLHAIQLGTPPSRPQQPAAAQRHHAASERLMAGRSTPSTAAIRLPSLNTRNTGFTLPWYSFSSGTLSKDAVPNFRFSF